MATAILGSLWNVYLSWDRQWADTAIAPQGWGQSVLVQEQIRLWAQTNVLATSVLGLRVSVSDASFLGGVALMFSTFYLCMCSRRENYEIGCLLRDTAHLSRDQRVSILARVRAFMVFTPTAESGRAWQGMNTLMDERESKVPGLDATPRIMVWLPFISILLVIISEFYFMFLYRSPWRSNSENAWDVLHSWQRVHMVITTSFAALVACLLYKMCSTTLRLRKGVRDLVVSYERDAYPVVGGGGIDN